MPHDPLLLDLPEQLLTDRLLLRVPRAGDGPALHQAVAESIAQLRQFLSAIPWVAAEPSVNGSEAYARRSHGNFLLRTDMPFLVFRRHDGQLLGATGLHRPDWQLPKLELGYWCRSSQHGQGYTAEAVDALVAYVAQHIGNCRLELVTDEANLASRRVAERCGFELEGVARGQLRDATGQWRSLCHYARAPAGS